MDTEHSPNTRHSKGVELDAREIHQTIDGLFFLRKAT
jgi:hypothetical protein